MTRGNENKTNSWHFSDTTYFSRRKVQVDQASSMSIHKTITKRASARAAGNKATTNLSHSHSGHFTTQSVPRALSIAIVLLLTQSFCQYFFRQKMRGYATARRRGSEVKGRGRETRREQGALRACAKRRLLSERGEEEGGRGM